VSADAGGSLGSAGTPRISTEWSLAGQPAVVLENRHLRTVLLPGLGGKIISLVDKAADTELLWRNDRVPVRPVPFGSGYDDVFLGGWDELFPNDEPEVLAGELMPDHGELWSVPWTVREVVEDADEAVLELTVSTPVSAVTVTKRLVLGRGPTLRTDHRVTNTGRRDLPFLWKSHVAVRLHGDTAVDVAAAEVDVHAFGEPRVRPEGDRFVWPVAMVDGIEHDFRRQPDTTGGGVSEFLIATTLTDGRCGVLHPAAGSGLTLTWDPAELPSCWTFASYGGGWRGLDVLVLEPCTGHPLSVLDGVAAGTHQVLPAGATRAWSLTARVGLPVS
jgi:galactose mutarotase-like enzyme